jgi:hypothetical protein
MATDWKHNRSSLSCPQTSDDRDAGSTGWSPLRDDEKTTAAGADAEIVCGAVTEGEDDAELGEEEEWVVVLRPCDADRERWTKRERGGGDRAAGAGAGAGAAGAGAPLRNPSERPREHHTAVK